VITRTRTHQNTARVKQPSPKLDKREAIVMAARELFTGEGYETTTMAQVASQAGVAVGTVYLYFKSKQELLYAVREDWEDEFLRYMTDPAIQQLPHEERARPLIEAVFTLCRERTEMVQLMGIAPQAIGDMHHFGGGSRIRAAIKLFFDEGVARGVFRDVDTERAAVLVYGMVNSALEDCFYVHGGQHPERYIEALVDALEHYLGTPEALSRLESIRNGSAGQRES
jgi:AcrR family transcriptional regulator